MNSEKTKSRAVNIIKNKNIPGPDDFENDLVIIGGGPCRTCCGAESR